MSASLWIILDILHVLLILTTSQNSTVSNTPSPTHTQSMTKLPWTTVLGELYATINPSYHSIIQDLFLPDDYQLPTNIYDWNVSQIVSYINASDPAILYEMDTAYLIEIFPEYFLQQLPRDILVAHQLFYLLPSNDTSFCSNCTNFTSIASSCVYPFVKTQHDTYFQCM